MEFDGKGEWCFGNDYGRDVIVFVVDNGWSSHADNLTHKLLVLGEKEKPLVLMKTLVHQKKISIILLEETQNIAWVYIIMLIIVSCLLKEKKSLSFKLTIEMLTFQINFASEVFLTDWMLLGLERRL